MVLGLRSKNRKGTSVLVDYLIHIQEIKPWPSSQYLKSVESVLLQWDNGDQSSGCFTSNIGDGKVEFSETFRLPVTLFRETSRKGTARDSFQKNYLELSLYEVRKDRAMKGQLLGSAVINLSDYGIIKDTITISTPINFKKISKSTAQPVVYVNIQPFDRENSSLSKEVSLDKDGSESVSGVTNEGCDEESEIASFTDDDVDDNISSFAFASSKDSPAQDEKNLTGSATNDTRRNNGETTLPSGVARSNPELNTIAEAFKHVNGASTTPSSTGLSSNLQICANDLGPKIVLSDTSIQVGKNSNHVDLQVSQTNQEADKKGWNGEKIGLGEAKSSNVKVGLMDGKLKKGQEHNGQEEESMMLKNYSVEEENFIGKLPQEPMKRQANLRSNTLSSNRISNAVQGNTRRDKLKHLKSVQLQFNVAESDESFKHVEVVKKANKIDVPENFHEGGLYHILSEKQKKTNHHSDHKIEFNSEVKMLEKKFSGTATEEVGLYPAVVRHANSIGKDQLIEKAKEIDTLADINKVDDSCALSEREKIECSFSGFKVEMESEVEMLKEELMEAAVLEVALYSVVAEHGSSANKVHAPARRLSRFYLHACKASSQAKRASAARAIISGLVLASKACGNDVPRLTFWLSNSIVLRAIVSQVVEKLQLASAPYINPNGGKKGKLEATPYEDEKTDKSKGSDEWEEPQTFIVTLERVEAWIFSRIVESVWWQTLTPHMQPTAVKGSNSRKAHARRYELGDQEQGHFAIDLWKKAFKDACERLCPIRSGGHECGCLPVLARLIMEQLVQRLDVAMFNAILRESADEMPTDPVSDPISDPKVLPIPAGKSSFGAGAQLKNAVGNWSRWLTDLFGIDDNDSLEDVNELDSNKTECETSFKAFQLLNALSDLMMLPFEMLADRSTRKEVCPIFGARIIEGVLNKFVPDEFNPYPIPEAIFESLDSEDPAEDGNESITSSPCMATPLIYSPLPPASLTNIIGEVETQSLQRSGSTVLRKAYASDDELDELDSPMTSIIIDNSRTSAPTPSNWMPKSNGGRKVVRYQLLRQVWRDGE